MSRKGIFFKGLSVILPLLYSINLHAQDSLKYSHFYWAALGIGNSITSTVPNYSGINGGISVAFPYKRLSLQIDGSLTSPNTSSSLYSNSSVSLNIGKVFIGKHFWTGGYIGPAFIFGNKSDGTPYETVGLNIDIPLMLRIGANFSIGAVGFTNYGIGYNATGVRLSLVVGGDIL